MGTQTHPSTPKFIPLLGLTTPSTLFEQVRLACPPLWLLVHPPPHLPPPPTSFCLPDPCTVKRAHIVVTQHRCAPAAPSPVLPRPFHYAYPHRRGILRLVVVAQLPPLPLAGGILGLIVVAQLHPFLHPTPLYPPNQDTHAIPFSLSPRSSGPQSAPMWMRTDFPASKCAHCKEAECRARSGTEHEAQATAAPPHRTPSRESGSRARVFDPDSSDEDNGHSIEQESQAPLFWALRSSGDARRACFSPVVDHCISLV
ncbi:hypothetical protein C8F04DRAFT_1265736 [Mycena alexandri]|uniref:Uncharacterized protein n=1 Tax=Mycena alexandri TaxID=1745969 RepID=A0AAD6WXE8_9AGAR|nr:hypothetical protein C8F04DRAFT_1265736 [Mycena alexandri]